MLELSNINLHRNDETRFDHAIAAGETTVVLGANRSGKTDLCRLIAGLPTQASGGIQLDGKPLDSLPPQLRPVAMVYQAFINYPNLTVQDNIASPLRARRMSATKRKDRVRELAAQLQITELLERFPHQLSGGQQQRVAIARALARDARVLLLDEPLVNLDFKLREALQDELRDLLRAADTIVIYTSSDPRDAFALGDQVLMLADGRKVQSGPPLEVYRRPASLGAMELLADPGVNRFAADGTTYAIRPEHLALDAPQDGAAARGFDMRVTAIETSGDESFIHGEVAGSAWVARCRGMCPVKVGSTLLLHARRHDILSF